MAYSAELLTALNNVPCFKEYKLARQASNHFYNTVCRCCQYPIIPVGEYRIGQNPSKIEKIQSYSIDIINCIGSCLALYGFVRSSPLALALGTLPLTFTTREIGKKCLGLVMCPAAISGLRQKLPKAIPNPIFSEFIVSRQQAHSMIISGGSVTNLKIIKHGMTFDAYFMSWPGNPNTRWVVHALDGSELPDWPLNDYPLDYSTLMDEKKFNHVIIAGPSVGYSTGWPAPENIGEGYSAVIQLLEQIGTTHIVMEARGLFGGLTLAKAIETHDFSVGQENNIQYLAISISTANSFSDAMKYGRFGRIVESLIKLCGMDINCEKMNQKLLNMNIRHIVVGHNDPGSPIDGFVHDKASLYKKLEKMNFPNVTIEKGRETLSSHSKSYWMETNGDFLASELEKFLQINASINNNTNPSHKPI